MVTDDGQHAVIDGNNSLIIVDSTGDVRRLELSLAEGETLETSSLAASDSSFYWITSRIDEISGATQQLIWRSTNDDQPELAHTLVPGERVQQLYESSWLKRARLQGDLFLLEPEGFSGEQPLQLIRLPRVPSSSTAQPIVELFAPWGHGGSGDADLVVANTADGAVNVLVHSFDRESGSAELRGGRIQQDGSFVFKSLGTNAPQAVGYGSLSSAVKSLPDGGFLVLDGADFEAKAIVSVSPDLVMGPFTNSPPVSSWDDLWP